MGFFGDLWKGSRKQENISNLTPEQQQQFSSFISTLGPEAQQTFSQFLGPRSEEDMSAIFEKSYTQPAMQALQQQTLPNIQQHFADLGAGSSGALNQALSQAAAEVSIGLGAKYGDFYQNQEKMQLEALRQFLPLLSQSTFNPTIRQKKGIAGPFMSALGTGIGGAVGGPAGAGIGGSLGGALGSSMSY